MIYYMFGALLALCFYFLYKNINLFSKVKVDYSIKTKKNYKKDMSGEYAIYVRTSIFDKWHEKQTYAMLEWAKADTEKLKKELQLPKYY